MSRYLRALVLAAAMAAVWAVPAGAHQGNPNYRSVIDRVTPTVPGVKLQVLGYDSYFQLTDQHGHEVDDLRLRRRALRADPHGRHRRGEPTLARDLPQRQRTSRRRRCRRSPTPKAPPQWKRRRQVRHLHLARPPHALDGRRTCRRRSRTSSKKTKVFDYKIPLSVGAQKGRSTARCTGSAARAASPWRRSSSPDRGGPARRRRP